LFIILVIETADKDTTLKLKIAPSKLTELFMVLQNETHYYWQRPNRIHYDNILPPLIEYNFFGGAFSFSGSFRASHRSFDT